MKFTVELISNSSGRLGCLTKAETRIQTPFALNYTKCGSIPYIAREVLDEFKDEPQITEVSIGNSNIMLEAIEAHGKGISEYCGLGSKPCFVTLQDTAAANPTFHQKDKISVMTRGGKININSESYMRSVVVYKADAFHALCDGDTDENSSNKRIGNSVDRTLVFFDGCLQIIRETSSLSNTLFLAPLVGGFSWPYRNHYIKALNNREHQDLIGGYFIDGFHRNGASASTVNESTVCELVSKSLSLVPSEKVKVMLGAYSPLLILRLVQIGVDVFDNTYAFLTTTRHCALTFDFDSGNAAIYEIDLSDSKFADDFTPLYKGCKCLACTKHTRGYIHHLTNTRELLGPILLMIHNLHHFAEFFRAIRHSIANDSLQRLIDLIERQKLVRDKEIAEQELTKSANNSKENVADAVMKRVKISGSVTNATT